MKSEIMLEPSLSRNDPEGNLRISLSTTESRMTISMSGSE
jgi:hypothetical protein